MISSRDLTSQKISQGKVEVSKEDGSVERTIHINGLHFLATYMIGDRLNLGPDWVRVTLRNGTYQVDHIAGSKVDELGPVARFLGQKLIENSPVNGTSAGDTESRQVDDSPRAVLFNFAFSDTSFLNRSVLNDIAAILIQDVDK